MASYTYLTQEGHDRLRGELEEMKTTGRQEVARAIAEAREKGDLSENAEYDAAKHSQGLLEMRINELERTLANSRILDESQMDDSEVRLLSNVTVKNKTSGKQITYKLVSESEADLTTNRISVSSPMGRGLLGKKVGELAKIDTPRGLLHFEVVDISMG
ncbi:MAG: transcription elongation factor GreA [Saprospirales bacterium]|nr:transcription elongation factor GreA [Saprospirales bacterium]MBK7336900.1 transcription elongation factor GreA [Saprospirales bacterium]